MVNVSDATVSDAVIPLLDMYSTKMHMCAPNDK